MSKKDFFIIFPYLKTTNPVLLRGIVFRSSDDLNDLSAEQQEHLKTLFAMFFLRNNLRIKRMVYACVEFSDDYQENYNLEQRLYEAQTLINYRYGQKEHILYREHASMYIFNTAKVSSSSIWPENHPQIDYNIENMTTEDVPSGRYIDGYNVMLNGKSTFESLFNLESIDKVTARFEETVMTLLGSFPRLDSWLKQFYDARSSVVHKGVTQHSMFYTRDREKTRFPSGYGRKNTAELTYGSLTFAGRNIFRLCLTTMLSGAKMAESDKLSSLFVHNQERLDKILEILKQKNGLPEKRLHSIAKVVNDLHDHHQWASEEKIQSGTLVAVGILVIETYLATKPQLSEQAETSMQELLQQSQRKDISPDEKLLFFEKNFPSLNQGLSNDATNPFVQEVQNPAATVLQLLRYVASPRFFTRRWLWAQDDSQDHPS